MLLSVTTKNLNWEILTRGQLLLNDGMWLKMKSFNIMQVHWKGGHSIYKTNNNFKVEIFHISATAFINSQSFFFHFKKQQIKLFIKQLADRQIEFKNFSENAEPNWSHSPLLFSLFATRQLQDLLFSFFFSNQRHPNKQLSSLVDSHANNLMV